MPGRFQSNSLFIVNALSLSQDGCTTEKLAQGIRAFVSDTNKLEAALRAKL